MLSVRLVIVVALASALAGGGTAWTVRGWQKDAVIARMQAKAARKALVAAEQYAEVERLRIELTESAALAAALRSRERETVERVITRDVIKYVQSSNATDCGLSADGVRIHDAAATGRVPQDSSTAGRADAAAAGVENAEVIQVVSENYSACRAARDQFLGLQSWVRAMRRAGAGGAAGPSQG